MQQITLKFLSIFCVFLCSCGAENTPKEAEEDTLGETINATITTVSGEIKVKLYAEKTPVTVANFVNLAERGYWTNSNFHRVVAGFVSQGGKHNSGIARPGYTIKNETYTENPLLKDLKHSHAGILAMARTAIPHSNGCQWYITHKATPNLDGDYTVFGEVTSGLETAVNLKQGDKILSIKITSDTAKIKQLHKKQIAEWNTILDINFDDLVPVSSLEK